MLTPPPTLYIDESGDTGFAPGSSKHLVIAAVVTTESRRVAKCAMTTRKQFRMARKVELHATRDRPEVRRFALSLLARTPNTRIQVIVCEKANVSHPFLREGGNKLWNFLAGQLLTRFLASMTAATLIVDQRKVRVNAPHTFDDYLKLQVVQQNVADGHVTRLNISHEDSMHSSGVQMADYVAHALFLDYERNDPLEARLVRQIMDVRKWC